LLINFKIKKNALDPR